MNSLLSVASLALSISLSPETIRSEHSPAPAVQQPEMTDSDTLQRNKQTVRQLFEYVINGRRFSEMPAYVSEKYEGRAGRKGPVAFQAAIAELVRSFPDIQWRLQDMIAEGRQVMVKWQWTGTHKADFQHISATGLHITHNAIAIFTLEDGKVTGSQLFNDRLGFLQALEQLPADESLIRPNKPRPGEIRFIDQFTVPAAAKKAFLARLTINRALIKTLPGFLEDEVLSHTSPTGDFICITIAKWESAQALEAAKTAVAQAYEKENFHPASFLQKLGITMERGVFGRDGGSSAQ